MSDGAQNSTPERVVGRPFTKGDSRINPGGRPRQVLEVIRLAREHTAEAVETLVDIMRNGDKDQARVAAANAILDRGWGRPPAVPISEDEGELVATKLTAEAALKALLAAPRDNAGEH